MNIRPEEEQSFIKCDIIKECFGVANIICPIYKTGTTRFRDCYYNCLL